MVDVSVFIVGSKSHRLKMLQFLACVITEVDEYLGVRLGPAKLARVIFGFRATRHQCAKTLTRGREQFNKGRDLVEGCVVTSSTCLVA